MISVYTITSTFNNNRYIIKFWCQLDKISQWNFVCQKFTAAELSKIWLQLIVWYLVDSIFLYDMRIMELPTFVDDIRTFLGCWITIKYVFIGFLSYTFRGFILDSGKLVCATIYWKHAIISCYCRFLDPNFGMIAGEILECDSYSTLCGSYPWKGRWVAYMSASYWKRRKFYSDVLLCLGKKTLWYRNRSSSV